MWRTLASVRRSQLERLLQSTTSGSAFLPALPSLLCETAATSGAIRPACSSAASGAPIEDFKVAVFSASPYVRDFLEGPLTSAFSHVKFIEARLEQDTAVLANGFTSICCFVNDVMDAQTIAVLAAGGVRFITQRCAGYDRIDLEAAKEHGLRVLRVPAYSPRSVAEHALALTFTLARNLHLMLPRTRQGNYTLDGLIGFEVTGKTFGIVGTGKIGVELIKLLQPFKGETGRILAHDVYASEEAQALGAQYVPLETLLRESDVVSLHCPLLPETHHLISTEQLKLMKPTAILINVGRGALVDTDALIHALEVNQIGGAGVDVYEQEGGLFFTDWERFAAADRMRAWDRRFKALTSLPNVVVTPHSAFLTNEALKNIADTTVDNLRACARGAPLVNEVALPS